MKFSSRRVFAASLAFAMAASLVAAPAFAQVTPGGATVGPAGGIPSSTANSNGQGTPSGGTGTLGTTRVGPSGVTPMASPATPAAAPMAPVAAPRPARHRVRRHRRVYHRPAAPAEVGTQSQSGTNGSMAPSR